VRIEARVKTLGEHAFVHEKYETQHFWQWKQRCFEQHHEKYIPFHMIPPKGVSPLSFMG
jgi:hypothetical protein